MAATLERSGFLARSGERYRLGVEIMRLGTLALRSFDVVKTMQAAMEKLSQATGKTVNLAAPDGPAVLNVAEVPSLFIPTARRVGPAARPSPTRSPTARCSWPMVPSRCPRRSIALPPAPSPNRASSGPNWPKFGRRDAAAVGELEEDLVAVASPVFDGAGRCVAALSISGPGYRLLPEKLGELGRMCAGA